MPSFKNVSTNINTKNNTKGLTALDITLTQTKARTKANLNPSSLSIERRELCAAQTTNLSQIFTFLILATLISILFSLDASATTGMTEFKTISTWITSNLGGALGNAAALGALAVGGLTLITNPRWSVLVPCGGIITLTQIAPKIVNSSFSMLI